MEYRAAAPHACVEGYYVKGKDNRADTTLE
jgi:hypothetical protein